MLLLQFTFLVGINSSDSPIWCKLVSVIQHYLHLSSYLWLFLVSLHLYRMLTELRDINKAGTCSPVFYYVIAYVVPAIVVSLTLGIKQDMYTNMEWTRNVRVDLSSVYCWLNVGNYNELFFVLLLPIGLATLGFLLMALLSYHESKKTTFKQTDMCLVYSSLIGSLVLLPVQCLLTVFLLMFLSATLVSGNAFESTVYQHVFLGVSFLYSLLVLSTFILFNKTNKSQLAKSWDLIKTSSRQMLNESWNNDHVGPTKPKQSLTAPANNYKQPYQVNKEPLAFAIEKKNIIDDNNVTRILI
jgi:hypothetical protein